MNTIRKFHFPVLLSGLWLMAVGSFVQDCFGERLSAGTYGRDLLLSIAVAALVPCVAFFLFALWEARRSAARA